MLPGADAEEVKALPDLNVEEVKALPDLDVEALISGADRRALPAPDEAAEAVGVTEFCRKQGGGRVRNLFRKAFSFVAVLASPEVPRAVFTTRMGYCRNCLRLETALGRLWCGCCGCSRWTRGKISSSLEYKNTKAAWGCPLAIPAFGPWKALSPDPVGDLAVTIGKGSILGRDRDPTNSEPSGKSLPGGGCPEPYEADWSEQVVEAGLLDLEETPVVAPEPSSGSG